MNKFRCISIAIAALNLPCAGWAQGRQSTDLAEIDRAVAEFTGADIGVTGGARAPVDRRLRLVRCQSPLAIAPYGRRQDSLEVACPDVGGWRIFVPLAKAPPAAAAQNLVTKGDSVSITIEGRGFSVVQSGRALESGAEGAWIRVEPQGDGEIIRARIDRPGRVVIPLG